MSGHAVEVAEHAERIRLDATWLDAHAAAATFLSRVFLAPPDGPLLVQLGEADVLQEWPMADEVSRSGLAAIRRSLTSESMETLGADYQHLFIGPERMLACPYESVYLGEEHLTFGPETLAVRRFYRRFGVRAPAEGREPDDHIGLELGFVSHLCLRGLDAVDQADEADLHEALHALAEFTSAHLLRWADEFLDHVDEHAETDFYSGVADLTRGLLRSLEADLVR